MQERGFDGLQQGMGPILLIAATVLTIAIIFAGGIFMQMKERQDREAERREKEQLGAEPRS